MSFVASKRATTGVAVAMADEKKPAGSGGKKPPSGGAGKKPPAEPQRPKPDTMKAFYGSDDFGRPSRHPPPQRKKRD